MPNNIDANIEELLKGIKKLRYSNSSFKKFELLKLEAIDIFKSSPSLSNHISQLREITPELKKPSFVETFEKEKKDKWDNAKKDSILIIEAARKLLRRHNFKNIQLLSSVSSGILENLKSLRSQINISEEANFYNEVVKCYEVGAFRSAIIMMWNLTVNHMFDYILTHKLTDYNNALTTKFGGKAKLVSAKEDFNNYKESVIIEVMKIGGIIDMNIRKILDIKLGIRNTVAHPSNLIIAESKVVDVIEDLTNNVIKKYQI